MAKTIEIPDVTRDDRIGSAFNSLFSVIFSCENCNDDVVFDFSGSRFFHPFFIAPLAIYKDMAGQGIGSANMDRRLESYLSAIHFDTPLMISDVKDIEAVMEKYSCRSYIPLCKFDVNSENRDIIESKIQDLIERQVSVDSSFKGSLSYILSELITNIAEHSKSDYGYFYSQYMRKEGCVDICVADCGISIIGSYVMAGKFLEEIGDNDAVALLKAISGYSTKERPGAESRGFGISTSSKMLVDGLGGAMFILSGGAFFRNDENGEKVVKLPDRFEWKGTISLLRIPTTAPKEFNIYSYI